MRATSGLLRKPTSQAAHKGSSTWPPSVVESRQLLLGSAGGGVHGAAQEGQPRRPRPSGTRPPCCKTWRWWWQTQWRRPTFRRRGRGSAVRCPPGTATQMAVVCALNVCGCGALSSVGESGGGLFLQGSNRRSGALTCFIEALDWGGVGGGRGEFRRREEASSVFKVHTFIVLHLVVSLNWP